MRELISWCVQFARAAWRALGWRCAVLVAAVTYLSTWWDWAVQRSIDYVPPDVFLALSDIPGWMVATNVAAISLAIVFALGLMPKVKLEFEETDPRCVVAVKYPNGAAVRFFRLRVSYLGVGTAFCYANLASVEKDGRDANLPEPVPLTFAPAEDGKHALRKRLGDGIPANLDVAYVVETGRFLPATEFDPEKGGRVVPDWATGFFDVPGEYKLRVVVSADELASEHLDLIAHVTGAYDTTTVEAYQGDRALDDLPRRVFDWAKSSLRAIFQTMDEWRRDRIS